MNLGLVMKSVGAHEARNRLSELLQAAASGEEITITKHGTPVAQLVPVKQLHYSKAFDRAKAREAVEWLKEFRKTHSLGGLTYRELIDAGRRY